MRRSSVVSLGTLALLTAGCATTRQLPAVSPSIGTATAMLRDASGNDHGRATFTQTPTGVLVQVRATGLPPGTHGLHVHAVGRCSPDFAAAGPHFNPSGMQHGYGNPQGPHAGDLPNLYTNGDGTANLDAMLPGASLGGAHGILDADGAALVVHATNDDYRTDPAGNSGARIACGVITQ